MRYEAMNRLEPNTEGISKAVLDYTRIYVQWKSYESTLEDKIKTGQKLNSLEQVIRGELITNPRVRAERVRLDDTYWEILAFIADQGMEFH